MDYRKDDAYHVQKITNDLRNRIVHDYGAVDLQIVYSTLNNDVPFLLKELSGEGS